ncbi:hypothetical protein C1H46_002803, partial [Malus baccata]
PKNCQYVIISGATQKNEEFDVEDAETFELPADEERGKLADPFYRLEHQEEDLQKKKEAEPLLVRLQRISDDRHLDDYSLNKALRAKLRSQKKRVAEEEAASRKMGLGLRLLPVAEEDAAAASRVKFVSKFEKNRKDKRKKPKKKKNRKKTETEPKKPNRKKNRTEKNRKKIGPNRTEPKFRFGFGFGKKPNRIKPNPALMYTYILYFSSFLNFENIFQIFFF